MRPHFVGGPKVFTAIDQTIHVNKQFPEEIEVTCEMSNEALKKTVAQLDGVRESLEVEPEGMGRDVLLEQQESLLAHVNRLCPHPEQRKAVGVIGPQGETRRRVRAQ